MVKDKYLEDMMAIKKKVREECAPDLVDRFAGIAARELIRTVSPGMLRALNKLVVAPGGRRK